MVIRWMDRESGNTHTFASKSPTDFAEWLVVFRLARYLSMYNDVARLYENRSIPEPVRAEIMIDGSS